MTGSTVSTHEVPKNRKAGLQSVYLKQCEVCSLPGLDTAGKLTAHLNTHVVADEPVCPILSCRMAFRNGKQVQTHLLQEHHKLQIGVSIPLAPEPAYQAEDFVTLACWECQAEFKHPFELDSHIREHLPSEYPKCCMLTQQDGKPCKYVAEYSDQLARHVVMSHYEVKFECSVCGNPNLGHDCPLQPDDLVGVNISVRWQTNDDDGEPIGWAWFDGTVKSFHPESQSFEIDYDDDTKVMENLALRFWRPSERIFNKDVVHFGLDPVSPASASTSAKKRGSARKKQKKVNA